MTSRSPKPRSQPDRAFKTLAAHLQLAAADLTLFYALCESIRRNDGLTRCAHDFVWFTVRALRDAGISHLYRLYDTNPSVVSLPKFIRASSGDSAQRKRDLRSVSPASASVKKLLQLRHKAIGHTSEDVLDLGHDKFIGRYALTLDEMQQLLTDAQVFLERYGGQEMAVVTPASNDQAGREVGFLATYLGDAVPKLYGIERITIELDGHPQSKGLPSN